MRGRNKPKAENTGTNYRIRLGRGRFGVSTLVAEIASFAANQNASAATSRLKFLALSLRFLTGLFISTLSFSVTQLTSYSLKVDRLSQTSWRGLIGIWMVYDPPLIGPPTVC